MVEMELEVRALVINKNLLTGRKTGDSVQNVKIVKPMKYTSMVQTNVFLPF